MQAQQQTVERRVPQLLQKMREGDRDAAGQFMREYGPRIRQRVRRKLNGGMRRLFDSQEILSTIGRKLDLMVKSRSLTAEEEGQLWALVFQMAERSVIDKARIYRRLQKTEGRDAPFAHAWKTRLSDEPLAGDLDASETVERAFECLDDPADRELLSLWLQETPHSRIAELFGVTPGAVRGRWRRIRETLQSEFSAGAGV